MQRAERALDMKLKLLAGAASVAVLAASGAQAAEPDRAAECAGDARAVRDDASNGRRMGAAG